MAVKAVITKTVEPIGEHAFRREKDLLNEKVPVTASDLRIVTTLKNSSFFQLTQIPGGMRRPVTSIGNDFP